MWQGEADGNFTSSLYAKQREGKKGNFNETLVCMFFFLSCNEHFIHQTNILVQIIQLIYFDDIE